MQRDKVAPPPQSPCTRIILRHYTAGERKLSKRWWAPLECQEYKEPSQLVWQFVHGRRWRSRITWMGLYVESRSGVSKKIWTYCVPGDWRYTLLEYHVFQFCFRFRLFVDRTTFISMDGLLFFRVWHASRKKWIGIFFLQGRSKGNLMGIAQL